MKSIFSGGVGKNGSSVAVSALILSETLSYQMKSLLKLKTNEKSFQIEIKF